MDIKSISLFSPKPEPYTGENITRHKLVFVWFPKILAHHKTKKIMFIWLRYIYIECSLKNIVYYYQKDGGNGFFFSLSNNSKRLSWIFNKNYLLAPVEKYTDSSIFLGYRYLNSRWYEDLFEKVKSSISP